MAKQAQALTTATPLPKPATFNGTSVAWNVLCDLYPTAETSDVIVAALNYCAVRHLDPFKKPVHIVPMYNTRLRRKVQTIMQGINEIEITASRTGKWAGMERPVWGPIVKRVFTGTFENDDGSTRTERAEMMFPESCSVTVYRMLDGQPRPFTEELFWLESYARAAFRSELPNARWQQAPRQMLHKCTKAAVLRAAFPEEGLGYSAEEMEDREVEDGGVTIDGTAEREPAETRPNGSARPEAITAEVAREAMAEVYADRERDEPAADPAPPVGLARLENETNPSAWVKIFYELVAAVTAEDDLGEIARHWAVRDALSKARPLIRDGMNEALREAQERVSARPEAAGEAQADGPPDLIADLLAEVAKMDLPLIQGLPNNNNWQALTRDLFPTDADRVDVAIAERRKELEESKEEPRRDDHSDPAGAADA